jgi:hypothetical protein
MLRRCNIKKVFGKTIHKNMSASELKFVWDSIPKELRKDFPELSNMIGVALTAEKLTSEAVAKFQSAKKTLETQKEIVLAAAATTAGNPSYSIAKIAEETAKASLNKIGASAIQKTKSVSEALMNKMMEIGGCKIVEESSEKLKINLTKDEL